MIYEIRTYRIAPRSLAEVEKRFGEAYEYPRSTPSCSRSGTRRSGHSTRSSTCGRTRISRARAHPRRGAKEPEVEPRHPGVHPEIALRDHRAFKFVPEFRAASCGPDLELRYYTLKPRMPARGGEGLGGALPERNEALAAGARGRRRVPDAPTLSCTSGRTRALDQRAQVAPKVPSGHLARRRRPATASSRREQGSPARPFPPPAERSRADGTAPALGAARPSRHWSYAARRASSVVIWQQLRAVERARGRSRRRPAASAIGPFFGARGNGGDVEHGNRGRGRRRLEDAADLDSRDVGQVQVEDDDVGLLLGELERLLTRGRFPHLEACS